MQAQAMASGFQNQRFRAGSGNRRPDSTSLPSQPVRSHHPPRVGGSPEQNQVQWLSRAADATRNVDPVEAEFVGNTRSTGTGYRAADPELSSRMEVSRDDHNDACVVRLPLSGWNFGGGKPCAQSAPDFRFRHSNLPILSGSFRPGASTTLPRSRSGGEVADKQKPARYLI